MLSERCLGKVRKVLKDFPDELTEILYLLRNNNPLAIRRMEELRERIHLNFPRKAHEINNLAEYLREIGHLTESVASRKEES